MDYGFVEYPTVDVVSRASTTMAISLENENGRMLLTASNNQQEGYTDGGNKTVSQYVSLSVTKPSIDANGDITAIARMSAGADNMITRESSKLSLGAKTSSDLVVNGDEIITPAGYYPHNASAFVQTGSLGEILASANNATGIVNIRVSQTEGYVQQDTKTKELKLENDYLIPANIKKGVTIFGVTGTMESGASIATCTVNITFSTNADITLISATTFANGAISVVNHNIPNNNNGQSVSIPNVVCGSALSINTSKMVGIYWSGSKKDHYGFLGGTITVPNTSGTYSVGIGVIDD